MIRLLRSGLLFLLFGLVASTMLGCGSSREATPDSDPVDPLDHCNSLSENSGAVNASNRDSKCSPPAPETETETETETKTETKTETDIEPPARTCTEISACVDACSTDSCAEDCIAEGSSIGQLEYSELRDCALLYCTTHDEDAGFEHDLKEDLEHCMESLCSYEQDVCLNGHRTYLSASDGEHCDIVLDCAGGCDGLKACEIACIDEGNALARRQFVQFQSCMKTHCEGVPFADYADSRCAQTHCTGEGYACVGYPTGEATCQEMMHCILECQDYDCRRDCYIQGTAQAQDNYNNLLLCGSQACSNLHHQGLIADCHAEVCGRELNACFGPGLDYS